MDWKRLLQIIRKSIPLPKWVKERIAGVTDNVIANFVVALLIALFGALFLLFKSIVVPFVSGFLHSPKPGFFVLGGFTFLLVLALSSVIIFTLWKRRRAASWISDATKDGDFVAFTSQVCYILEKQGFSIESSNTRGIDLIGVNEHASPHRVAVVIEGRRDVVLKKYNVKAIQSAVKSARADTCYYISRSPRSFFHDKAIVAASKNQIKFTTYRDFALKGINFEPYLQYLISSWQGSKVGQNYIETAGRDEGGKIHRPLEALLDEKLSSSSYNARIALLGDFGTGKTTFLRYYASLLAQRHLADPIPNPIPIVINLKDYELVGNIGTLISRELSRHNVSVSLNPITDIQLRGKFVIMLDAFDEMSLTVDRVSVQRNLQKIEDIVSHQSGAFIVSCRTHFFRDRIEEEQFRTFFPVYLEPWGKAELTSYLQKAVGTKWKSTLNVIRRTHNLEELSRTPLFLDMIADSIDNLSRSRILSAELYTIYTNKWINAQLYKTALSPDQKADFMEELAWKMLTEGRRFIPSAELRDTIQQRYRLSLTEVDRFDNDIRTCSFLHRPADIAGYTFSHNSFLEFFVARYAAKQVKAEHIEELCKVELPYEVMQFMAQLLDELIFYERLHLWLEFKVEPEFALARRNAAQVMRIISRSPLASAAAKSRAQMLSELSDIVLSPRDPDTRWKAIVKIGWLRSPDSMSLLRHVLSGQESEIRVLRIVALVLGLLGDGLSIPLLTKLLREGENFIIRQNCAVALGLLGDSAAIPDLIDCLQHEEDHQVRRSTIWAIETVDPVMARSALTERVLEDTSEEVRQYAVLALGRVGGDIVLDTLEKALRDPSSLVRRSALESLGRIGGPRALQLAENRLNDPDEGVRESSRIAINHIRDLSI